MIRISSLLLMVAPAFALTGEAVTLKEIMQGLRDDLVEISDGLLMDDFESVKNGAAAIAAHPQISPSQVSLVAAELGPEMAAFKQLDTLVHDLSLEIKSAAEARNRDAAIAGYQRMIEGCFVCHETYKDRISATLNQTSNSQ